MAFFTKPNILIEENHINQEPKINTWRKRFEHAESWGEANPWDQVDRPTDKEIKLCITEVFEALDLAIAGFRFIQKECDGTIGPDQQRNKILTTAKTVADILEGC